MNQNKTMKDFWTTGDELHLIKSGISCDAGKPLPVDIELLDENQRISDIYWTYDDPNQNLKSLMICQKMPVLESDGTINFKKWKVIFFNDGPDSITFTIYIKKNIKVGKVDVKPSPING